MVRSFLLLFLSLSIYAQNNPLSIIWHINRTDTIGGYAVEELTDLPDKILTPEGESLLFDGVDDALFIENNPLGEAESFTIEIILRPDSSSNADDFEQRYIHIRRKDNDDRRILMELRLTTNQQWYLDTYIRSEINNRTLVNPEMLHPAGSWYHIALVYDNGMMRHYVNGVEELSGEVTYQPIGSGQISIGARQNPKSWFKGAIRLIKFTKQALKPGDFISVVSDIKKGTGYINTYRLFQNFPNPFNPATTIKYKIEERAFVNLSIYDAFGRMVTSLCSEEKPPETYTTTWNGKNEQGSDVCSGVYFCRLQSSMFTQTTKMLLIR